MTKLKYILPAIILLISFFSCNPVEKMMIKPGYWNASFLREDGVKIPFTFLVSDSGGIQKLTFINADERLVADQVIAERSGLKITMPFFDSDLYLRAQQHKLEGFWLKHLKDRTDTLFLEAFHSDSAQRFMVRNHADVPVIASRWDVIFVSDDQDTTIAVAEFQQNDTQIKGTFLTTTGDYRFLEGVVSGDGKVYLSCFDGSHAFLFTATLDASGQKLEGDFYSGRRHHEKWSAVVNADAALPDATKLTFLKKGYQKLDFTFPDLDGNRVSINDQKFKDKVIAVQILGSWCPNCLDETRYLSSYYDQVRSEGFEVIGLAYERNPDFAVASRNVSALKKRLGVNYDILIAGTNEKGKVLESLPMLENFMSYPTTFLIDKKGVVRKIHTGFSGPATGIHFVKYKEEFENDVRRLLQE